MKYNIALSMVPGIGGVLARNLVAYLGSPEAVFKESYQALRKIPGIGEVNARRLKNSEVLDWAEREMEYVHKNKIQVWFYTDATFPRRLKNCPDAPVLLYVRGNLSPNINRVISIVGTRKATDYGKSICENLIAQFAERKYQILVVSGLAYGIDVQAHKSALNHGIPTLGVVAHGHDTLYPSLHRNIARRMLEQGGVISDFSSGTKIDPANFIRRNRIIAGMADATLVVESAEKGGALITADIASSYNRDVFAFPGRVGDPASKGCNRLIRENGAALIEGIDDLEYFMGWEEQNENREVQAQLFVDLNSEEETILKLLKEHGRLFIDQISALLQLSPGKISPILLGLEFKNLVRVHPGQVYDLR